MPRPAFGLRALAWLGIAAAIGCGGWILISAPRPAAPAADERARIVETNDGAKPVVKGGAAIVDADGRRLELVPSKRRTPSPAAAVAALPKLDLPVLDDPSAGLEKRKRRAQGLLLGGIVAAFGLLLWARRWRPDV